MNRLLVACALAGLVTASCGSPGSTDSNAQAVPKLSASQAAFFDAVESLKVSLNGSPKQAAALSENLLNGNQAAITDCMTAVGFDYLGPLLRVEPTDPIYEGGWEATPDTEFAAKWGFGIFTHDFVPPTPVVNPAYEALAEGEKVSYDAALDKCAGSPDASAGYGFGGQELWSDLRNSFYLASMRDEFAPSRRAYSRCMAAAGYKLEKANGLVTLALEVAIGDTHVHDYLEGTPEHKLAKAEGIADQRTLAVADVRCRIVHAEAIVQQLSPVLDDWLRLHQSEVDAVVAKWDTVG